MAAERVGGHPFPEWVGGRERLKERKGKDVEVRARFMRHEHRAREVDPHSALSPEGQQQADTLGKTYAVRKDGIFFRSSPVGRAYETTSRVRHGIEKRDPSKVHNVRVRKELDTVTAGTFDDVWEQKVADYLHRNYPDLEQLNHEERKEAWRRADDEVVDWWFGQGDHPADPRIPSARSVAAKVAVLASRVINTPEKIWNKKKLDELFISHKPVLEAFLKEILLRPLKDEKTGETKMTRGFQSIKEIGGSFLPGEGWELLVHTDAERTKSVKLHLRGVDYSINLARLEELRREGIEVNRERRADELFIERMRPDLDF